MNKQIDVTGIIPVNWILKSVWDTVWDSVFCDTIHIMFYGQNQMSMWTVHTLK